jgi:hypothetical protein
MRLQRHEGTCGVRARRCQQRSARHDAKCLAVSRGRLGSGGTHGFQDRRQRTTLSGGQGRPCTLRRIRVSVGCSVFSVSRGMHMPSCSRLHFVRTCLHLLTLTMFLLVKMKITSVFNTTSHTTVTNASLSLPLSPRSLSLSLSLHSSNTKIVCVYIYTYIIHDMLRSSTYARHRLFRIGWLLVEEFSLRLFMRLCRGLRSLRIVRKCRHLTPKKIFLSDVTFDQQHLYE